MKITNELWKKWVWLHYSKCQFPRSESWHVPIFLHLTQFNYLFTNYFITVVFNLIYYIYSLHLGNIKLSKDGFVWIAQKQARMMYALFCSLSHYIIKCGDASVIENYIHCECVLIVLFSVMPFLNLVWLIYLNWMVCGLIKSQTKVIEFQWVESELCSIHVSYMYDRYFKFFCFLIPTYLHTWHKLQRFIDNWSILFIMTFLITSILSYRHHAFNSIIIL